MGEIMPRVSIIMNCYNGGAYLREAIDSIYAQTFTDWEIIFWDNASTDASSSIARSYGCKIRYHRSATTTPLGAARNGALSLAQGEYVAFLDTDDKWMSAKLAEQVRLMDSNPRLGLAHTDVLMYHQSNGRTTHHFDLLGHRPPRGDIFGYLLKCNAISMPSVMLRLEALHQQQEWFDERFEIYPDYDLFRRIAHGWECDYIDEPLAFYRVHNASSSTRNHSRAADELTITLEKLRNLFPEMDSAYAGDVASLRRMIAYQKGKSFWRDGYGSSARTEFGKYWKDGRMALAYLASFLPFSVLERVWWAIPRNSKRKSL